MRLIVLDAGDSFKLDGYNKLLLKNPQTNKTIIEEYEEKYPCSNINIVVGYNAIAIANQFPKYNYTYNSKWQTTNNSYSLALVLDETPSIITSSDFFISDSLVKKIAKYENCIVVKDTENKQLDSLNIKTTSHNKIDYIYYGKSKNNDFELLGIFKISDKNILNKWKQNSLINQNKYIGENLPISDKIEIIKVSEKEAYEINEIQDYLNFIRDKKQ
jgi:choline kinase